MKFAKVMFLHLSVSHSVHRGGCLVQGVCCWGKGVPGIRGVSGPWGGVPGPGVSGPGRVPDPGGGLLPGVPGPGGLLPGGCLVVDPPWDAYCCGRYASYWNAFLFGHCIQRAPINIINTVDIQRTA